MIDYRSKLATEMECLYRLIKSFQVASRKDLVRLSGHSDKRVRYHLEFFIWYGIATQVDDGERILGCTECMISPRNLKFVEGRFPTPYDFFYDAYIETFAWDGED
jgi:hypothetical protein